MTLTLLLTGVLIFSLFGTGPLEFRKAYASPYQSIDVDTAYDMITNGSFPDLVVLDVRTKSEYDGGHIRLAVWIPYDEIDARISELAGHENHEIIVYCKAGGRSAIASANLEDNHGFTKVHNMLGGMDAWQSAGYPVYIAAVHNLSAGWNMVSFPCLPDDASFSNILSSVGFYQVLTWDGTSYVTPDTAEAGRGYWVLVLTDTTVTVADGIPVASYELDLPAGWSMIGSILPCTVDADCVFPDFYQLLTWDGTSYVTATTILEKATGP
jgi:rhodanese-related sulfurtransferase